MNNPLVTVVMPLFNHAKWVNEALDSVIAQDYPDKRIVVVDDKSTDNSASAVSRRMELIKKNPFAGIPDGKFRVGHIGGTPVMIITAEKNGGPAPTRNIGLRAASDSDLFMFLDSDDLYYPGKISRSVEVWKKDPEVVGCVYSDFETFNDAGLRLRQYKPGFSRQLLLRECIVNCDSLVSKKAIDRVGGFDESLRVCEDYNLWLRLSEHFLIRHIPECLVGIRIGEHSSTSIVPRDKWESDYRRATEKFRCSR